VRLSTIDGVSLAAELRLPPTAWGAAVLCHPHPRQGGSMRSSVISLLFDALPAAGIGALRFDFRGVGDSGGTHGDGVAEAADVVAALASLHEVVEGLPLLLTGWSFGADVSLTVADDRLGAWLAIAPPLRSVPLSAMVAGSDPRPKVVAVPAHDQFNPPDRCRPLVQDWVNTRLEVVPGADHFLTGRVDRVAALAIEQLEGLAGR
jgi:alpha/beta superfamily hydrolase